MTTDWFPILTNVHLQQISPQDQQMVDQHIGQFFDAHIADRSQKVSVPINCPHPWPSVLTPVWLACNRDEEEAAKFLGNLYCRYAIKRPELWMSFPDAVLSWKPRRYVVQLNVAASAMSHIPRAIK